MIWIVLSFILLALISDIILIHVNALLSADGIQFCDIQFHLRRVMELREVLHSGHIQALFGFNYFHGSPVMSVYPYYILLLFIPIFNLTSSYVESYYLYFVLLVFISLIICFYSSYSYKKSKVLSYLFSVSYTLSIPFLMDYFFDEDIGLVSSLVFFPLVIFGFLNLLNKRHCYLQMSSGLVLMSLCQVASAFIALLFVMLWSLININFTNKKLLKNIIKSFTLTMLLTSIIWIPILKITLFNNINTPGSIYIPLQQSNLMSIIKNTGLINLLSVPFLIILVLKKRNNKIFKQMLILSIIVVICSSTMVPLKFILSLKILRYLNNFQFTARFLIIPHLLLCYLMSYYFLKIVKDINSKRLLVLMLIICIIILQILGQVYIYRKDTRNYMYVNNYKIVRNIHMHNTPYLIKQDGVKYLLNGYLNNDDYYPKKSNNKTIYINNNKGAYNNKLISLEHIKFNTFEFSNNHKINRLLLPIFHYKGEHICLYVNGKKQNYHINKNDIISINNIKKGNHKMLIKDIENDRIKFVEFLLMIIGVIWVMVKSIRYCILFKYNNNKLLFLNYKHK